MEQDDCGQAEMDDVQEAKRGAALAVFWALQYEVVDKASSEERLELHTRISSGNAFLEALNLAATRLQRQSHVMAAACREGSFAHAKHSQSCKHVL